MTVRTDRDNDRLFPLECLRSEGMGNRGSEGGGVGLTCSIDEYLVHFERDERVRQFPEVQLQAAGHYVHI